MKTLADYDPSELKLIYRLLHGHLQNELDLMDSELLHDLQRHLQALARAEERGLRNGSDASPAANDRARRPGAFHRPRQEPHP